MSLSLAPVISCESRKPSSNSGDRLLLSQEITKGTSK